MINIRMLISAFGDLLVLTSACVATPVSVAICIDCSLFCRLYKKQKNLKKLGDIEFIILYSNLKTNTLLVRYQFEHPKMNSAFPPATYEAPFITLAAVYRMSNSVTPNFLPFVARLRAAVEHFVPSKLAEHLK